MHPCAPLQLPFTAVAALLPLLLLLPAAVTLAARADDDAAAAVPAPRKLYVSNSTGSDMNSGLSTTEPLGSMEKAIAMLQSGDTLLLKRGDGWTITSALHLGGVDSLTTPSSGVTIAAYGPAAERPLLSGTAATAATIGSGLLRATNLQGLRVEGISFARAENALSLIYTKSGGIYANVSILDCHFRDVAWANFTHRAALGEEGNIRSVYGGGNAIQLQNAHREECLPPQHPCAPPTLQNLAIMHNLFERVDMAFTSRLARVGLPAGSRMGVSTEATRVEGNLFTQCSFNVVMIDAAVGFSLQHNVFLRNKPVGLEHGSRPVNLARPRLFGYGTTDVIIGYADATTVVRNNDFVLRDEYEGGPDGCAIDLETACHNLVLGPGNTFYKNVGAAVNIFGHTFNGSVQASQNLTIIGNTIVQNGCKQGKPPYYPGSGPNGTASGDVGALAFDLPGGSGHIAQNLIVQCADESAPLWGGSNIPSHVANFSFNNTVVNSSAEETTICALPGVLWDTRVRQWPNLVATCATPGATLRYTVDGSRPNSSSPQWPPSAQVSSSAVARQTTCVLVRAFKNGMLPSATAGYVRYV